MSRRRVVSGAQLQQHASMQVVTIVLGVLVGGFLLMVIKQGLKRSGYPDIAADWGSA